MTPATFFYDADCGICTRLARLAERLDRRGCLRLVPLHDEEADILLADLDPEARFASSHLVEPGGRRWSGARGMAEGLALLFPVSRPVFRLVWRLPGAPALLERAYAWFAANRYRFSRTCGLKGEGG